MSYSLEKEHIYLSTVGKTHRFKVNEMIDCGTFGKVYEAEDSKHKNKVAIKVEPTSLKACQLIHQCNIYRGLILEHGRSERLPIPEMIYCATEDNYNVLVIEKLGPSLKSIFRKNVKISLRTTLYLAEQMINALQFIHKRHVLHRDIKPSNFCLGLGDNAAKIYLIDFGLAKKYIYGQGIHIQQKKRACFIGNYLYASINSHLSWQQSRRDDLESLGYMIIHLVRGSLPWEKIPQNSTKSEQIMNMKINIDLKELCYRLPEQFIIYINTVRSLKFYQQPNYEFLRNLFRVAFIRRNFVRGDFTFE